jgi:hypothetical protein
MKEKFTIEELMLANELCFPSDFERLLKKHLPEDELDMLSYYVNTFREKNSNLITWIFSYSRRSNKEFWGSINEKIVLDLLNRS